MQEEYIIKYVDIFGETSLKVEADSISDAMYKYHLSKGLISKFISIEKVIDKL